MNIPNPPPKAGPTRDEIRAAILDHLGQTANLKPDRIILSTLSPEARGRLSSALKRRYRLAGVGPDVTDARTVGELVEAMFTVTRLREGSVGLNYRGRSE